MTCLDESSQQKKTGLPTIAVTKSVLPPLEDYVRYLGEIWANHWLTNDGALVQMLGSRLEEYLGVKNLVLMSNGTLALQTALRALALKGEVITTPFTFAATTNALIWQGLTPVFADIDPRTYNIDPCKIEGKITPNTSAILAVHVYGNPCYIEKVQQVARKHNLKVIYDAAHAFGVEYAGKPINSYGDVSVLSFHATKVFNTIEGGAVIANDQAVVAKLKLLRNHGIRSETEVVLPGTNAKMNEFQAAMGLCNLESVDAAIDQRKALYERYVERLSELQVGFQRIIASKYNYSYMPVLFESQAERDFIYSTLAEKGIKTRKYFYPLTVDYDYFKGNKDVLAQKLDLTNAINISNCILCLPLYPELSIPMIDKIAGLIALSMKRCTVVTPKKHRRHV